MAKTKKAMKKMFKENKKEEELREKKEEEMQEKKRMVLSIEDLVHGGAGNITAMKLARKLLIKCIKRWGADWDSDLAHLYTLYPWDCDWALNDGWF